MLPAPHRTRDQSAPLSLRIRLSMFTHVFLLLVDMANLEPNVLLGERSGRVIDDVFEALRKLARSKGINGVYDAPYL